MAKISICYSYFNQTEALKQRIDAFKKWSKDTLDQVEFIIGDDCSPTHINDVLSKEDLSALNIQILRVNTDIHCNITGVQNLMAHRSKSDRLLIMDMDFTITEGDVKKMLKLDENIAYKFKATACSRGYHCKICLISKKIFNEVGGYDEDFAGHYGASDNWFWNCVKHAGHKIEIAKGIELENDNKGRTENKLLNRPGKQRNEDLHKEKRKHMIYPTNPLRFEWEVIK